MWNINVIMVGLWLNKMNVKILVSCLCTLIAYAIIIIFGLSIRLGFEFPLAFYWFSFIFALIPTLLDAVFWKTSFKFRIFNLLSFSLLVHLQYVVLDSSPFLASVDAIADYRLTDTIIANSQWSTNWVFGFGSEYQFYPTTNSLYATFSMVTGIPLFLVVKYLFLIKAFFVPLILNKWFNTFFKNPIAHLGTVLFLSSPGAILFPHKESFAIIFFFLAIYSMFRTVNSRKYLVLGLFSVSILIMTHHFTSYLFLGILTSLFIGYYIFRQKKVIQVSTHFFLSCWIIFGVWSAFIALQSIRFHEEILYAFLSPKTVVFSEMLPLYVPYEMIIIYLGYAITAISAGVGFLIYMKKKNERSSSFLPVALFLIPLVAFAFIFRFTSANYAILISHRVLEFGYILVGITSALFFFRAFRSRKRLILKGIVICTVILMVITGPMAGAMYPPTFDKLRDVLSSRAISLNEWMSQTGANEQNTVGDRIVFLLLVGYGDSKVVENQEFFTSQDFGLPPDVISKSPWYIVTYQSMSDFYGLDSVKIGNSPYFHSVYTNGVLNTYCISNRTSS
jgi:hypothetical protein